MQQAEQRSISSPLFRGGTVAPIPPRNAYTTNPIPEVKRFEPYCEAVTSATRRTGAGVTNTPGRR